MQQVAKHCMRLCRVPATMWFPLPRGETAWRQRASRGSICSSSMWGFIYRTPARFLRRCAAPQPLRACGSSELLARTRSQLRMRRAEKELLEKMHIAEEGQQIAHTAFEALAVTEKMTSDAVSLDRRLKVGVTAVLIVAALMAGIYFLFAHNAQKQTQRANSIIAKLEGGIVR